VAFELDFLRVAQQREEARKQTSAFSDPYSEFLSVLQSHGFDVTSVDDSDKIVRCKAVDSKDKCCWYSFTVVNDVGLGVFGDWRDSGENHHFISSRYNTLSPEERRDIEKTREILRIKKEKEEQARQAKAAKLATNTINAANNVDENDNHPYLVDKGVKAFGLKRINDDLLIPIKIGNEIASYQKIDSNGVKYFLEDGKTQGGYHFIQGSTNKLYFVEGYATGATVHQATKANVMVCFNAGNLYNVIKYYREISLDPIIIAADNDWKKEKEGKGNAGIKCATKCCKEFSNVTMIYPESLTGSDFNDLAKEKGADEVRAILGHSSNRIKIQQVDQLEAQPELWFIKKVFPQKKICMVFGQSGHMKSFLILDIALHLAAGFDNWHGAKIKEQHNILYVCGEGASGIRNRVIAWKKHHKVEQPIPFYMTSSPVLFLEREQSSMMLDSLNNFMYDNKISTYPSMIIIDTLNRNFGAGDENSTKDMTDFINALEELHSITGSMFIVVHHSNKSDHGQARGNASLKNACDCEYQVEMTNYQSVKDGFEAPKVAFVNTKMKDYALAHPYLFTPVTVHLGVDEDNDPITSVAMRQIDSSDLGPKKKTDLERCKELLHKAIFNIASLDAKSGNFNTVMPVFAYERVVVEFNALCKGCGMTDSSRRKNKPKAIEQLCKEHVFSQIGENGDFTLLDKKMIQQIAQEVFIK
jgi:phage/plasmid primase-like uncharacterized protein